MNAIVALSDTSYMIPYSDFKIINWTLKENDNFLYWKSAGIYVCFVFLQGFRSSLVKDEFVNKIYWGKNWYNIPGVPTSFGRELYRNFFFWTKFAKVKGNVWNVNKLSRIFLINKTW